MHGLYLLWWVQEKGMPPALVASVLAAGDLALAGFEIPTGWFADRVGHRCSLIAGSLVQIAGMFFCWLGEGLSGLVAASVLVALGDGFRSGADQALLYRSCHALGCEREFLRLVARARAVQTVGLVALVLAGGAIVQTWGFAAGWTAEVVLCVTGLAIACAMAEPPAIPDPTEPEVPVDGDAHEPVAQRASFLSTRMALLILPAALLNAAAGATSFLAQTAPRLDPVSVTTIVAALALAEAAGSVLAMRRPGATFRGQATLAAAGVSCIAAALALPSVRLAVAITLAFLAGLAGPLRAAAIQQLAADEARARAASIASAVDMVWSTMALPLAGWTRSSRSRCR